MRNTTRVFPKKLDISGPGGSVSYELDPEGSDLATVNFIGALVGVHEPTVFVEAGTYRGMTTSAIAVTYAKNGIAGHIWTAEVNKEQQDVAIESLEHIGLDEYVTFYHGKYEDMLKDFAWPIDFAYIDGGERLPMIEMTLPKLSKRGMIMVDDLHPGMWGDEEARLKVIGMLNVYIPYHRGIGIIQPGDKE